ncbi:malate synthase G [Vannielia litorea]|uniref:malate synthase G n=1 Tax=Vannielia litorea TaxID=1217970 RepID=UPI001C954B51|nr:malate synthase G [Vannielia litorea]MBY6046850.1 malate synthase G [Vannielia litorea]MBY6074264.1 malate synthase G [Vannielia litorea]
MTDRIEKAGLQWDAGLAAFVENEILPGTGVEADVVWENVAKLVKVFGPRNAELLAKRQELQEKIDAWHVANRGAPDMDAYQKMLGEIGYLVEEPEEVAVEPEGIDPEISSVCGPQLVVPITNARFALNAANARWGSLYDALYGTNALGSLPGKGGYDAERGKEVVAWAKAHLDKVLPLKKGSWAEVSTMAPGGQGKLMVIAGKHSTELADPDQYAGCNRDEKGKITDVYFRANGLHIVMFIDRSDPIGSADPAGIADIFLEAAVSTIMDMEDSVAVVDAEDKVQAYRNWLGLMKGDLTAPVGSGDNAYIRELNPDLGFESKEGRPALLKGRALMLVRNVDLLMYTDAVLDEEGNRVPEGLLDAFITPLCALHDIIGGDDKERPRNSPKGSIYIVKPKMHGPEEVEFVCKTFEVVELILGLRPNTIKIGIMDEERRTSANLKACIAAAEKRLAFINTGFLDRTGDEIHTSIEAGPMVPKGRMKAATWLDAYENRNVDIALQCGLKGRAQIGKGMWALTDDMAGMLEQKKGHLMMGGTTAWVPSPTAAVLHATHYHETDVFARLYEINEEAKGQLRNGLDELLTIPLQEGELPVEEIQTELENNCQSLLGYVVRWVDQGVGCSKVPDVHDVPLMEDRATLRISAQALANWLLNEVVSQEQVLEALKKMAAVVDQQNAGDPAYKPMAPGFDGVAFQAACDLVFKGRDEPSGYTQNILQARRIEAKAQG